MTSPEQVPVDPLEPRMPALWAWAIFVVAALSLMWPMLSGQFLAGDDQVIAGYGFRSFAAEFFKQYGHIPQWNPFIFGGMPFFGVIGHGDIFYPTAWLRWVVDTDIGMTLGFYIHLVIAGGAMYALLRGLRLSWAAAVVGGVAYELSGIVASQISPGHDGKLFVSALAPLALLALLRAMRHRRLGGYGAFAVIVGLAILSPQVQMAYYLLVASGLFALWLAFLDPERPTDRSSFVPLAWALGAALLGIGIAMIQVLPILTHVQYTPRAAGGDSVGWDYATSYAFHIKEFLTVVMPQFNGVLETYWGDNGFKSHTEYLGALVVVLAVIGLGAVRRRGLLLITLVIGGLFLLISLAADTPFYRLWYEVMPMMKSVRAAGMAFYLVALMVCIWAAHGADRLLRGEAGARTLTISLGVLGALGLLAVAGLMESMSYALADPRMVSRVAANVPEIRLGGARLLLVVIVGGGVLIAIQRRRLTGALAAGLLIAVVMLDNWSVLRHFAKWLPPAEVTYASDELIATMQQTPLPYRVLDPGGDFAGAGVYGGSILMGHKVPTLFGYHGMESRWFDDLFGTKNIWTRQLSPTLWDLYGVEYIVLNQEEPGLPGFTQVAGPVSFPNLIGRNAPAGFLYRRDVPAQWARVVPGAIQVPEDQMGATIADPGFPVNLVALFPDTSTISGATGTIAIPDSTSVRASLTEWRAGRMTVALEGTDPRTTYLLVAENWYPDWRAVVDGVETPTYRANLAMIGVPIPSGAREVQLEFAMADYTAGRIITALSLLGALGLVVAGRFRRKPADV